MIDNIFDCRLSDVINHGYEHLSLAYAFVEILSLPLIQYA